MVDPSPQRRSGIYAITCRATGHQYIGSARDIDHRWHLHRKQLDAKCHHSPYLERAWHKYGAEAFDFTIVELVPPVRTELLAAEQRYLDARFAERSSHEYNMSPTAGSPLGVKRPPELRQKWSEQRKGKPWTPERRAKYRYTDAMREANAKRKGRPASERQYKAVTTVTPGRLAHVMRLVELQTGRPHTPEWSANISKGLRERSDRLEAEGKLSTNPRSVRARERRRAKRLARIAALEAQLGIASAGSPPHQPSLFE